MANKLTTGGFMALFVVGIVITGLGPSLPFIVEHYDVTLGQAGLIFAVRSSGSILAVLLGGPLSDVLGRRAIVLTAGLLITLGNLAFALVSYWPLALAASFLLGIGLGCVDGSINPLIVDVNRENPGPALNMLHVFFGVGALVGPLVAGYLLQIGWRCVFLFAGLCGFIFLVYMYLQDFPRASNPEGIRREALTGIFRSGVFWSLFVIMFIYSGVGGGLVGWMNTFLRGVFAFSTMAASLVLSSYHVGLTAGRLACSRLVKTLPHTLLLLGCGLGAFLVLLMAVVTTNSFLAILGFTLTGFFFSGLFPTSVAHASSLFPELTGTVSGLLITGSSIGMMTIPWLMGQVAERLSLRAGMGTGAGLVFFLVLSSFSLEYRRRRDLALMKRDVLIPPCKARLKGGT